MSDESEFFRRTQDMMACIERGDYAGALLVTEHLAAAFPSQSARTDLWRICMLSRLRRIDDALMIFRSALEAGMWWSESILRNDPDLAPLQGNPEFERVVAICHEHHAMAQAETKPVLVVREPGKVAKPWPVLIVLHPMSSSAEADLSYWEHACSKGWLVAAMQSSQLAWPGAYLWNDRDKAQDEVVGQFASLCVRYPVDRSRVIIGGMSQGGALAIRLVLNGSLPSLGFLSIVPGIIDQKLLEEWLRMERNHPVRGYLVTGGKDPRHEFFQRIYEFLPQHGIPCRMEDHPAMGHEYPSNFEKTLDTALYFLASNTYRAAM